MNALQQFKQKGRHLRKWMSNAFNTEVQLSQAYEAVAVMEGCNDWNQFSARLVRLDCPQEVAVPVPVTLPVIRAIFGTVDGKAQAEFDASGWFAQASEFDIRELMREKPRMSPSGYELSYGGKNGYSDEVAVFAAKTNADVTAVFDYIRALSEVGGDCGGSDCYIDAHTVQAWLSARVDATSVSSDVKPVLDVKLGNASNASRLAKVVALVRLDAQRRHDVSEHRPTPESDIVEALTAVKVVGTGGDGGFAPQVFDLMRQALTPSAPDAEPVYDTLQIFEVLMQDFVDEYEVPDTVPEWQWVQQNAAFSHRDNGKEDGGGVWEFMVHVEHSDADDLPKALKPLFAKARLHKAVWVMFHQGT